jgi:hypothetical protein
MRAQLLLLRAECRVLSMRRPSPSAPWARRTGHRHLALNVVGLLEEVLLLDKKLATVTQLRHIQHHVVLPTLPEETRDLLHCVDGPCTVGSASYSRL